MSKTKDSGVTKKKGEKGRALVPAEGEVVIWGGTLRPVPPPCRAGARSVVVDRSSWLKRSGRPSVWTEFHCVYLGDPGDYQRRFCGSLGEHPQISRRIACLSPTLCLVASPGRAHFILGLSGSPLPEVSDQKQKCQSA